MTTPRGIPNHAHLVWAWLHLSDIHVGHGNSEWQADQERILSRLAGDASDLVETGSVPKPDAILVTGDIGFSGAALTGDEYQRAAAWLDDVKRAVDCSTVLTVPGNHDVRRVTAADPALWRLVRDARDATDLQRGRPEDVLDERLAHATDAAALANRLEPYHAFSIEQGTPNADAHGAWSRVAATHVDGITVRVVGWNTAILCNDDDDSGTLRVTRRAVLATLPDRRRRDEIVVVLAHHPVSDLDKKNAADVDSELLTTADVHLHGHIHDARSEHRRRGDGTELLTITAGAVHGDNQDRPRHGYAFGALYTLGERDYAVAVWPRIFVPGGYCAQVDILPDGQTHAWHQLTRGNVQAAAPAASAAEGAGVADLAQLLLQRLGMRRTAYPTDMSIAELRDRDLLVAASLPGLDHGQQPLAPDDIADAIATDHSVLVVGDPGSGKTVLAYAVGATLLERGSPLPLNVDLSSVLAAPPASRTDLLDVAAATARDSFRGIADDDRPIALLVDGVDEVLASGADDHDVALALRALRRVGPLLVTCRKLAYERSHAAVPSELFNHIQTMPTWTAGTEFREFTRRLTAQGMLTDAELPDRVDADPDLAALVGRPLFARMLTYVATHDTNVNDRTSLYQVYIDKTAAATNTALARAGCTTRVPVGELWRTTAWFAFADRGGFDALPLADLVAYLAASYGLDPECAYRALTGIIDAIPSGVGVTAEFVHYSFYEFLVAQQVAVNLTAAHSVRDTGAAATALGRDLPQEIRRHLVRLLRAAAMDLYAWPQWFADVYRDAAARPEPERRTIGNLIAYILARLDVAAADELIELLGTEQDPFLRNSLNWALARLDDRDAVDRYVAALANDQELASLNRGYLLYYFGDLTRHEPPPYRDDPPHPLWPQTRDHLASKYADAAHANAKPSRQALDLYTWFDLLRVRSERVDEREAAVAAAGIDRLAAAGLPESTMSGVRGLYDLVRPWDHAQRGPLNTH